MTAKTLAMLKLEKNFVAVVDKNYPRKPYEEYPIYDPKRPIKYGGRSLIGFVNREKDELDTAIEILKKNIANINRVEILHRGDIVDSILDVMLEVADVSNTLDYLFEGLTLALETWEGDP